MFTLGTLLVSGVSYLPIKKLFQIGPDMKETDVNCVSVSEDKSLVASADNLGRVKVFQYPAYIPRQSFLSLEAGHVSHVKSVNFSKDDDYLVTVGSLDCTIMIWSFKAHVRSPNKNVISRKNT